MSTRSTLSFALFSFALVTDSQSTVLYEITGPNEATVSWSDIVFEASTSFDAGALVVFQDYFAGPSAADGLGASGSFNVRLNAGPIESFGPNSIPTGQLAVPIGLVDSNDLFFGSSFFPSVTAGDLISVSGSGFSFEASPLNPPANRSSVTAILVDGEGNPLAGPVTVIVPEPDLPLLACAGILGLGTLRHRRSKPPQ